MSFDRRGFKGSPEPYDPQAAQHVGPLHSSSDYRPNCASNIPPGQQAATRQWMTHNAKEIMALARKRHEDRIKAAFPRPYSPVEGPGYEHIVVCNSEKCVISPGQPGGIGIYRPGPPPKFDN